MRRHPFLISIPHGGLRVPAEVSEMVGLTQAELVFYSDPATRALYRFRERVSAFLDTDISRMIVDLNRAPYHLPPKHPDGVIKQKTVFGTPVYRNGSIPDIRIVHQLLMEHYFPYHAAVDQYLDPGQIAFALDCHSMLPHGPPGHRDAGRERPLICLGNNGDLHGEPRPGSLSTCPSAWIQALATAFREEFGAKGEVAINRPFSGGFITNAHFWHKGIPWIQVEVNRDLYERGEADSALSVIDQEKLNFTGERIWNALCSFWDGLETSRDSIEETIR